MDLPNCRARGEARYISMKEETRRGTKPTTKVKSDRVRHLPVTPTTKVPRTSVASIPGGPKTPKRPLSRAKKSIRATDEDEGWRPIGRAKRRNRLILAAVRLWELRRRLSDMELVAGFLASIQLVLRLSLLRFPGASVPLWGVP